MAILETERVSHNPIEVLQADSCTCAGKKSRPRTLSFREDEEKLRPGQLNATLTLTCMLHAQSIWQSWRLNGFLTTQEVLQADSCTCAEKSRPRTLSFREDEEKLRPGQLSATLTLMCMHALCMAILEELPLTQPIPANRGHAHVRKKRQENQARPRQKS